MRRRTMKELGRQLRCPSGAEAIEVGNEMFASNQNMIYKTIDAFLLEPGNRVLELGFGNGKHLPYLLSKSKDIQYTGVDISPAMVEAGREHNLRLNLEPEPTFLLVSGQGAFPLEEAYFDRFFTVNTLYFWPDVQLQLAEIFRVMKPGGQVAIACIEKKFGEALPFTRQGFRFLEQAALEDALSHAGFKPMKTTAFQETVHSKTGQIINRPYYITTANKSSTYRA